MSRTLAALLLGTSAAGAVDTETDKSQYTLFNPTPRRFLREMRADRPDVTESAYSVDAGHVQIEADLVSFTRDRQVEERDGGTESWGFGSTNVKLGLTNWADLQVVVPIHESVRGGPSGFGDIALRIKANLWGNDGGKTALAVMPFLKLPTADEGLGNDTWEGGIIFPFAADLRDGWNFGAMLEIDFLADDEGGGRKTDFLTSLTLSHDIAGNLGGYVEFVGLAGTETKWAATFNAGLTYGVAEDLQLDAGVNFGLTRSAEDVTAFVGFSYRY